MTGDDRRAHAHALRRARTARLCAAGFTRTPREREHHLGRARQWLLFARALSRRPQ